MTASSLLSRFTHGALWSLLGNISNRGLLLLSGALIASWYGKATFGAFGLIQSTTAMFTIFATYSVAIAATKFVADLRADDPDRAGRVISLSTLASASLGASLGALVFAFADPLADRLLLDPSLASPLRAASLIVLCGALNGTWNGALNGLQAFRAASTTNLSAGIASFPITLSLAYAYGLSGAVWGLCASAALEAGLKLHALRAAMRAAHIPWRRHGLLPELPALSRFSLPSLLAQLIPPPVLWLSQTILVHTPSGYDEVGLFNAALQWRLAILFIPTTLGGMITAMLSSSLRDLTHHRRLVLYSLTLNLALSTASAVGLTLFAPWVLSFYGASFSGGATVMALNAFATIPIALSNTFLHAFTSQGLVWRLVPINLLWAATLLLSFYLTSRDAFGLSLATLIASCLQLLLFIAARRPSPRAPNPDAPNPDAPAPAAA